MTVRGLGRSTGPSATRSRRGRAGALALTIAGLAATLSGCSWRRGIALGWPEGITPEAKAAHQLWFASMIAALVVGVIVWGLMFWTAAAFRKKKGDEEIPRQFGYNMPLELVLTVVPLLIVSVLFYFTIVAQNKMLHKEPNPEVTVDVTAFQWNWKFGYQKIAYADGSFNYDGADAARKAAMVSKPEGVDKQGEEKIGAIRGLNPEDRSYLNFERKLKIGAIVVMLEQQRQVKLFSLGGSKQTT